MQFLLDHYLPLLGCLAGIALMVWPPALWPFVAARRRARLAALLDGAPERFFEERRSLEAYGINNPLVMRLPGLTLLTLAQMLLW